MGLRRQCSGYPLRQNLMTPIPTTVGDRRYNGAFLKTRKTIECIFWHLVKQIKDKTSVSLCNKPDRISKLIVSTAILNNFRVNHGLSIEYDNSDQEMPVELAKTDSNDNGS